MLTREEQRLYQALVQAAADFDALQVLHPSDKTEFTTHIHALQYMLLARVAVRNRMKV